VVIAIQGDGLLVGIASLAGDGRHPLRHGIAGCRFLDNGGTKAIGDGAGGAPQAIIGRQGARLIEVGRDIAQTGGRGHRVVQTLDRLLAHTVIDGIADQQRGDQWYSRESIGAGRLDFDQIAPAVVPFFLGRHLAARRKAGRCIDLEARRRLAGLAVIDVGVGNRRAIQAVAWANDRGEPSKFSILFVIDPGVHRKNVARVWTTEGTVVILAPPYLCGSRT